MRLLGKLIEIVDDRTQLCCFSVKNRLLVGICSIVQLLVALASLGQHVYSLYAHQMQIFACQTNVTLAMQSDGHLLMAYDIIIFDYGLFHHLLGTEYCVANYLDGGYMRCLWCFGHASSLIILIIAVISGTKHHFFLWPALFQQSIYVLGLCVLNLATLPKLLVTIFHQLDSLMLLLILTFLSGELFNWFFTLVTWHYYWLVEAACMRYKGRLAESKLSNAAYKGHMDALIEARRGAASIPIHLESPSIDSRSITPEYA